MEPDAKGNDVTVISDIEIDRALDLVAEALNDRQLDEFDRAGVQEIVVASLGGNRSLIVDDGGGLHDHGGTRVGAIRRTPSGEWIVDRQNLDAKRSDAPIPPEPPD